LEPVSPFSSASICSTPLRRILLSLFHSSIVIEGFFGLVHLVCQHGASTRQFLTPNFFIILVYHYLWSGLRPSSDYAESRMRHIYLRSTYAPQTLRYTTSSLSPIDRRSSETGTSSPYSYDLLTHIQRYLNPLLTSYTNPSDHVYHISRTRRRACQT